MQLPLSVLFVCTGNSCRSILAEGLLAHHGDSRVQACSTGSNPAGFVHPLALETLANRGIELPNARSKSWDEFDGQALDCVLTICDAAAGEACPLFSGQPSTANALERSGADRFRGRRSDPVRLLRGIYEQHL